MQPKVKFLTVVWGEIYIERFCALSLPSFLAPGNIPALAQATDMEVVIMTRRDDFEHFEKNVTFKRLSAVCPVRFVEIDDLIATAVYGVTLTLAYARPIIACGEDMLNTYFVFMNADFVLANGSLEALCKHIKEGRSIVLAPSFRATAEEVEPRLEAAVDTDLGVLDMPTREMVELSIASPHRTTTAKIHNQQVLYSTHPNQFFWQVDEHTMLGRYFLIFMLCLKPERVIKTINCYCDYSFIPELCPSGNEVVMGDSDDFFMLELQSREQETHMLRFGQMSEAKIARSLQEWTTAEHRRASKYDIVFHSRDIPPEIEITRAKAQEFIDAVKARLGPPKSHINHKYWVWGVEAWKEYRKDRGLIEELPELGPYNTDIYFFFRQVRTTTKRKVKLVLAAIRRAPLEAFFRRMFQGRFSVGTPLRPNWVQYRLLKQTTASILADAGSNPVLVVARKDMFIDSLLGFQSTVRMVTPRSLILAEDDLPDRNSGDGYSHALLYLKTPDIEYVQNLINKCVSTLEPNGTLHIFITPGLDKTSYQDLSRLLLCLGDIFGNRAETYSIQTVGGFVTQFNRRLLHRIVGGVRRHCSRFGDFALFVYIPMIAIGLFLTLMGNLTFGLKKPSQQLSRKSSSLVIRAKLWGDRLR